jgi:hypothetical protein
LLSVSECVRTYDLPMTSERVHACSIIINLPLVGRFFNTKIVTKLSDRFNKSFQ